MCVGVVRWCTEANYVLWRVAVHLGNLLWASESNDRWAAPMERMLRELGIADCVIPNHAFRAGCGSGDTGHSLHSKKTCVARMYHRGQLVAVAATAYKVTNSSFHHHGGNISNDVYIYQTGLVWIRWCGAE